MTGKCIEMCLYTTFIIIIVALKVDLIIVKHHYEIMKISVRDII